MVRTTEHCYIIKDDQVLHGEPIIKGTRTPVRAIVETWRIGVPPEEIPKGLPHVTLAQVFDALSYYSDYQDEVNRYIEANRIPSGLQEITTEFKLAEHVQKYVTSRQEHQRNLLQLLDSWQKEDIQEDHEAWDYLEKVLDEDRLSNRRLFP